MPSTLHKTKHAQTNTDTDLLLICGRSGCSRHVRKVLPEDREPRRRQNPANLWPRRCGLTRRRFTGPAPSARDLLRERLGARSAHERHDFAGGAVQADDLGDRGRPRAPLKAIEIG